jgi:hypothetical protein
MHTGFAPQHRRTSLVPLRRPSVTRLEELHQLGSARPQRLDRCLPPTSTWVPCGNRNRDSLPVSSRPSASSPVNSAERCHPPPPSRARCSRWVRRTVPVRFRTGNRRDNSRVRQPTNPKFLLQPRGRHPSRALRPTTGSCQESVQDLRHFSCRSTRFRRTG